MDNNTHPRVNRRGGTMNPLPLASALLATNASVAHMNRIQSQRLRETIRHAATTPCYRKRFSDASISTAADLARLPITTRKDIADTPIETRIPEGADVSRIPSCLTSGSTGHPLQGNMLPSDRVINDTFTLRTATMAPNDGYTLSSQTLMPIISHTTELKR